jgi:hypothetical protein
MEAEQPLIVGPYPDRLESGLPRHGAEALDSVFV